MAVEVGFPAFLEAELYAGGLAAAAVAVNATARDSIARLRITVFMDISDWVRRVELVERMVTSLVCSWEPVPPAP
jgi:hypothetical protein